MLESDAEIKTMLSVAGEDIEFSFDTIKSIPGTNTFNINNYDSAYEVNRQEYEFQIAYTDFIENNITAKMTFTYIIRSLALTFEIVSYVNDLVGWVRLNCRIIGQANV